MKKILTHILLIISITATAQVKIAVLKKADSGFKQTRISSVLNEPLIQTGHFTYIVPDSICWQYDGLDNVHLPEQMLTLIKQAVGGNLETVQNTFVITWQGETLTLQPKKKQLSRFFTQIDICFNAAGVATKVCLKEPNGDQTKIEFINMKYTLL